MKKIIYTIGITAFVALSVSFTLEKNHQEQAIEPTFGANTTYYVSSADGNDSNDGLSEVSPWQTVSKVNGFSFAQGDIVKFKVGNIWYNSQLSPSVSGVTGNPITFTSYGTAYQSTTTYPIISGSSLVTTWTASTTSNVYESTGLTWTPTEAYITDAGIIYRGEQETDVDNLSANYEWYANTNYAVLYYDGGDPDTALTSVEFDRQANACKTNGQDYITYDGLECRYSTSNVFNVNSNSQDIIVRNSSIQGPDRVDFNFAVFQSATSDNVEVDNNVFGTSTDDRFSGRRNIDFGNGGSGGVGSATVTDNLIYNSFLNTPGSANLDNCVAFSAVDRGTIYVDGNTIEGCGASGIWMTSNAANATITANIVNNTGNAGINPYFELDGGSIYIGRNTVTNCCADFDDAVGIHINGSTDKMTIEYNSSSGNRNLTATAEDGGGFASDFASNNTWRYNVAFDNYGKCFYSRAGDSVVFAYNLCYNNGEGISVSGQSNHSFYAFPDTRDGTASTTSFLHNTLYHNDRGVGIGPNYQTEILAGDYIDGLVIRGNIVNATSSAISAEKYLYIFSNQLDNATFDHNLYHGASVFGYDINDVTLTLGEWQARGYDTDVIMAGGQFTNSTSTDFTLQSGSPAINAGVDLGYTSDYAGNAIEGLPDLGAFEFITVLNQFILNGGTLNLSGGTVKIGQ